MSEPLRKFMEIFFKGEELDRILTKVEDEGAETVEDLYVLTDQDFEKWGVKTVLRRKLMAAIKAYNESGGAEIPMKQKDDQEAKHPISPISHIPETLVIEESKQQEFRSDSEISLPKSDYSIDTSKLNKLLVRNQNEIINYNAQEEQKVSSFSEQIDTSSNKNIQNVTNISKFAGNIGHFPGRPIISKEKKSNLSNGESFPIFQSFIDAGSEYQMKKIKLNEDEFISFTENFKSSEIQVIGFYGCFEQILEIIRNIFSQDFKNDFDSIDEGIIFFRKQDRGIEQVAAVYKCHDPTKFYSYSYGTDQASLASTYLRYLVDICQDIVAVPPLNFQPNPETLSPFREQTNHGMKLKETLVQPDENVKITEIQCAKQKQADEINLRDLLTSPDQSKFLCISELKKEVENFPIKVKIPSISSSYYYDSYYSKEMTFEELKNEVIKKWPLDQTYFPIASHHYTTFQDKLEQLVTKFIPKEQHQALVLICRNSEQDYRSRLDVLNQEIQKFQNDEIEILTKDFINKISMCSCSKFKQCFKEEQPQSEDNAQSQGIFSFIKDIIGLNSGKSDKNQLECSRRCKQMGSIIYHLNAINYGQLKYQNLKEITAALDSFQTEQITIHKTFDDSVIGKIAKKFYDDMQSVKKVYQQNLTEQSNELRKNILTNFFSEINDIAQKSQQIIKYSSSIQFYQMNIIRNTDHKITGWNINKSSHILKPKLSKNQNGEIVIKEVFFITETSGLVVIDNCPEGKCSIYYFNIANRNSQIFTLSFSFSQGSHLIIDPHNFQWCLIYNQEQRASIGKLSKEGKIEEGIPISILGVSSAGQHIREIKSACFLPFGDKIILINQSGDIFEYKWQQNNLQAIFRKKNEDGKGVTKQKIRPQDENEVYFEVQASTNGKNIILRSLKSLDVYDLNWNICFSLPISKDFIAYKTFTDKIDNYLVVITNDSPKFYQLVGLTTTKTISKEFSGKGISNKHLGNPIFDHLFHGFRKFGPHSHFLGSPQQTFLHLFTKYINLKDIGIISTYFRNLRISGVQLLLQSNIDDINIFKSSIINSINLKMILIGRVALHLATIENSTLIPLRDGENISDSIAENIQRNADASSDLIEKISSMIKFGIYEKFLSDIKQDIKVISIVGRQSSGKSYVMNRFFGTRFNVAATRCTDGIWMSLVEIHENDKSQLFLVFDCEGLFSARRNDQEEMKLCLALAAISDIMILNQDSSFSRHLNSLFSNFTKCVGRIKGKQLFRGRLMMLVRDISKRDSEGTYRELESNFIQLESSKNKGFLSEVFQGELLSQCMHNFEHQLFDQEVEEIRSQYFMSLDQPRWISGSDFNESLKITLSQIFTDDDTDINIHKVKIQCERLFNEAIEMFFNGGEGKKWEDASIDFHFKIKEQEYLVKVQQQNIKLGQEANQDQGQQDTAFLIQDLAEQFVSQSCSPSISNHNEWIQSFDSFLRKFFEQRKNQIFKYLSGFLAQESDYQELIQSTQFKLKNLFEIYSNKIFICDKTCRKCKRRCSLSFGHKKDCDCQTPHVCMEQCEQSEECKKFKYLCVDLYGHDEDHRCNEGNHSCSYLCGIQDCGRICSKKSGHSNTEQHDCGNKHLCNIKCEDSFCTRICMFDTSIPHEIHECGEKTCIHKCSLCERQCIYPDHFHDQSIKNENNERLLYQTSDDETLTLNYHICSEDHECKKKCEAKGVCQIGYDVEERFWKSPASPEGFPYQYFIPRDKIEDCKIMIQKYKNKHEAKHDCKIKDHRCTEQCPECKSYCQKEYDHVGYHYTNSHRNKENTVFASHSKGSSISFMHEGKKREYTVGESCQPENCFTSCQRKGRAHFHIKECKDITTCDGKANPKIRHATEKFEPYPDKQFDKWLCHSYWNSLNWEPPIEGELLELASSCNFYCCHPSHGDEKRFCINSALHADEHKFDCTHKDAYNSSYLDVCFCCDTTGSMGSYIEKSKTICNKILDKIKSLPNHELRSVKFSFVAYRDHHAGEEYVSKYQVLTNEPEFQTFLKSVTAGGGGDTPEAVLDGLNDSINNVNWRLNSLRYIFHIADAPPHGTRFSSGISDTFPSGCPCGLKIETLAASLKEKNIRYKLLKIGSLVNTMAAEFKKEFNELFEEADLDCADQLDIVVSQIIVRDLAQEEIDVIRE